MGKTKRTKDFRYQIGDVLGINKITNRYIKESKGQKWKMYECSCILCDTLQERTEYELRDNNDKCKQCKGRSLVQYEDCQFMIEHFLGGYEEAKKYSPSSVQKVYMRCPKCGRISNEPKRICNLKSMGYLSCDCVGGDSYPERLTQQALEWLGIKFEKQYTPHWANDKKYDFYLPDYNFIIEVHGKQHYADTGYSGGYAQCHNNDLYKYDIAVINGYEFNKNFFVIDASTTSQEYIVNSFITNAISDFISFKEVDWDECSLRSERAIVKMVCDYKNENPHATTGVIAKEFHINEETARRYLVRGTKYSWCHYDGAKELSMKSKRQAQKVKVIKDGVCLAIHDSVRELVEVSETLYGSKFNATKVRAVCSGARNKHSNYCFEYYKGEE